MKKILVAIDGVNLNMPTIDFACFLGRLTDSPITGIFLENLIAEQKLVLRSTGESAFIDWETDKNSQEYLEKIKQVEKNISFFKEACEKRSVKCHIHRDRGLPSKEIIKESRFADLIVLDAATSFNRTFEGSPTEFVQDVLKKSECPVVVAPEHFESIDEIVFIYDGSKSDMLALKQFSCLFPQLDDKKLTLLQANKKGVWADPDKHNLKEWLASHYSIIGFETLKESPTDFSFDYLVKKKNVFIVMGAYGRSSVSQFLRHSHSDLLIRTMAQPIFISHY